MGSPISDDRGRECWLYLNDEYTTFERQRPRRSDFDPEFKRLADEFARFNQLPRFDELGDVDLADQMLRERGA